MNNPSPSFKTFKITLQKTNKMKKSRFIVLVNLGHRIARVVTYAENAAIAIFRVYERYCKKASNLNSYSPIVY